MSWWSDTFETTPPPGSCDGGSVIECCTDPQGQTTCAPTVPWFVPLAAGQAVFGKHDYEFQAAPDRVKRWVFDEDTPTDPKLAYVQARGRGYAGTPEQFNAEWAEYQAQKNAPGWLAKQVDAAQDRASRNLWDRLPNLDTLLILGGVAGGLWYFQPQLKKAIKKRRG